MCGLPRFPRALPGDDADTDTAVGRARSDLLFARRLGILDRRGADASCGRESRVGRARHEDARTQLRRERRRQLQLVDAIELALERDGAALEQLRDDADILFEPRVSPIVRSRVVERDEIVLEPAGDHVEIDAPPEQIPDGGQRLGHGVRVHVDRLHRNERAERRGVLDDDARQQPGVGLGVVAVHEDARTPLSFAPARNLHHLSQVRCAIRAGGWRARGEDLERRVKLLRSHGHLRKNRRGRAFTARRFSS